MATMRQIQTNFSSGELNPLMRFRSDTGAYLNGAALLRNVSLLNTGGVSRRPGTKLLRRLSSEKHRLLPFDFDENERYVCALSDGELKVYLLDEAATLVTTVTANASWTEAQLFELTYTQVADTMIVCHPSWSPRVIKRTSLSTFTISEFTFDEAITGSQVYQPYYKFANNDVTIRSSAIEKGATTTVTASQSAFTPDHVGTIIRWQNNEIEITGRTSSLIVTGIIRKALEGSYDIDPFKTTNGSSEIEVTHVAHGFNTGDTITISGSDDVGGIAAASINGSKVITVVNENIYKINPAGAFPPWPSATSSVDGGGPSVKYSGADLPTIDWDEQAMSPVRGWPACVCFHEGRLWFGGTTDQPDALFGSRINQYFNFSVGTGLDNEAIQIAIGSEDISKIQHIVSNRDLQIFTATGEFIAPKSTQTSLTPANMRVSRQTPYGSNKVTPIPFDGGTLFVQNTGKSVREYIYADVESSYASTDLSLLAGHLIRNPKDMDVLYGSATRNEQYAFLVNGDDGTLAVFHSARAEQLAGWTLYDFPDGVVDAVCCIGNALYMSVLRYGEYFLERLASDDSLSLDWSRDYESVTPTNTWTGLSVFYYNKTLDVVSDGYYLGSFTVSATGELTLPSEHTEITVGLGYEIQIKTLPVNVELRSGSLIGMPKRINKVMIGLDGTLNVGVQGNQIIIKKVTDDISNGETPFTGIHEFYLLGYSKEPAVTIVQNEPVAMRVLGLNMEVGL